MTEQTGLPFESFAFTLIEDKRPRAALRIGVVDGGMYELHVEKGSAANPTSQFTRQIPLESAQRLKDALQEIGVFGWAESYGGPGTRPSRRWSVNTVFKKDVFAVASKGAGEVPTGFDAMLEELYRLDFPRPVEPKAASGHARMGSALGAAGFRGFGGLSAGDLGAYNAAGALDSAGALGGVDFSQMADLLGGGDLPGFDASDMSDLLAEASRNPQALQQRMREEFQHMSPDEQSRMLDALASTGMASRAWWERFLRG